MEGSGAGPRAAITGSAEEDANTLHGEHAAQARSFRDIAQAISAPAALAGRIVSFHAGSDDRSRPQRPPSPWDSAS
eukprot:7763145-Heterocapsa_arctica.AAC.1